MKPGAAAKPRQVPALHPYYDQALSVYSHLSDQLSVFSKPRKHAGRVRHCRGGPPRYGFCLSWYTGNGTGAPIVNAAVFANWLLSTAFPMLCASSRTANGTRPVFAHNAISASNSIWT